MLTQSAPASSPLRKFEGLVARAQEDLLLTQSHLRDIRSQLIKMRSDTAHSQKNTHWYGAAMQIGGIAVGIGAGYFGNPKGYEVVTTTVNLFKTLIFDTQNYDHQALMEELQQRLASADTV
ncbi:MAG TPA: hypothetical protein VMR37_01425, partial [Rhabdochlamydiaceae bacterium]|nr:hypothetical protein [Rhabdochlamydiaceae bacterium]